VRFLNFFKSSIFTMAFFKSSLPFFEQTMPFYQQRIKMYNGPTLWGFWFFSNHQFLQYSFSNLVCPFLN
jgi:hypothetical protein